MSRSYGDRADGADKTRLLKKQIESLKKVQARTQKELNRALQRIVELESMVDILETGHEVLPKKKRKGDGTPCDKCGEGIMIESLRLTVAGVEKVYHECNGCGHRKLQK
jgi:formylmethanofuran dehydrogenase subunit E